MYLVWKAAILLNSTIKSQIQESLLQMLLESNRRFSQVLKDLQEKEERLKQKAREIKNATMHGSQAGGCPTTANGRAARPLGQPHFGRGQKVKRYKKEINTPA